MWRYLLIEASLLPICNPTVLVNHDEPRTEDDCNDS